MADNKGKEKVDTMEGPPPEQWQKEDVQKWFKKKGWEDRGQFFINALIYIIFFLSTNLLVMTNYSHRNRYVAIFFTGLMLC